MTGTQAVAAIERWHGPENTLGLTPIRTLLHALGDPQKELKFVHVAGSNGKGSTCAMLSSVLQYAGYRVGLFTSPYIQDFRERIQIGGQWIPNDELAAITDEVLPLAQAIPGIRQFALITAIAMVYFRRQSCDIVVLEVGMGGIVDATNAIDTPEVAVITNIGLEHTAILGRTVEAIAEKKAGIIKPGGRAVCYDGDPAVTEVIRRRCEQVNAALRCADNGALTLLHQDMTGQTFSYRGKTYTLPLFGTHQLRNAAAALETVALLRDRGWDIPVSAVVGGLAAVRWPARFEVLCRQPLFILDGGHNPQCAQSLADTLASYLNGEKVCCIMGVMDDKNIAAMIDAVAPQTARFYCAAPRSERALPAERLAAHIRARGLPATVCTDASDAIRQALQSGCPVVAFGSLYLAGEIRTVFPTLCKAFQRKRCLAARRTLSPQQRQEKSNAVCRRLSRLPEVQRAQVILSYAATEDEVTLTALHQVLQKSGKTIAYPVTLPGHRMEARAPLTDADWISGAFGIPVPDPQRSLRIAPEEINLVLVPCVGFDDPCHRLGHGGGYYDRYLAQCSNAVPIAAAFEAQHLDEVMTDARDIPMTMVVTEKRIYREK
ncbi:MAG: 5-formyltetrahydrofolate cyclo-ligase [Clostridiales bacterium]|nr:5-formyltetrahydrofolate cyclo-ligase [Candidatus Cacconaster stercorequi]